MTEIKALIFDVDGTLAETEELHRVAFNQSFAAAGLNWHWSAPLYAELLQITGGKERVFYYIAAHHARPTLDAAAVAALHADKTRRYTALIASGEIRLRPGVCRLMEEALANGIKLAIATTTSPANVVALLVATLGAVGPSRFAVIAAGDSVPAKKPAPDIYNLALNLLQLSPKDCLAFEDSQNGLRSAMAAGIPTIVTTSLYGGTTGFAGALACLDHLGEPNLPCQVLCGQKLNAPIVNLAQLRSWHTATA